VELNFRRHRSPSAKGTSQQQNQPQHSPASVSSTVFPVPPDLVTRRDVALRMLAQSAMTQEPRRACLCLGRIQIIIFRRHFFEQSYPNDQVAGATSSRIVVTMVLI
jgi:hypothetical protein